MLGAVAIFGGCVILAWKKRIIQNYWETVRGQDIGNDRQIL
jgi:hypothetical protein